MAIDAGLAQVSNTLVYSAMVVYTGAMYCYAADLAFGPRVRARSDLATAGSRPAYAGVPGAGSSSYAESWSPGGERSARVGRVAVALTLLAFALHLAAVVARGLSAGRPPWGNMYEFSTAGALAVTGAYLWLLLVRRHDLRYLGLFVVLPVLLTLGLAVVVFYTESAELLPALKSVWLAIHVSAAVLSSGVLTVGFSQSVLYLVQDRREKRIGGPVPSFMDRLPTADALDRAAYRVHAFAFPLWTFAVVAGAIWAENAWGRYWNWDPKEVWAFVTWVVYASYLHARATAGWRGRKAAWIALGGYGTFLFNYVAVNIWFAGLHSYGGLS